MPNTYTPVHGPGAGPRAHDGPAVGPWSHAREPVGPWARGPVGCGLTVLSLARALLILYV